MLFDLFRDGLSINLIVNLMARVFVIFCILPIHEFAHALVAKKLGDRTAEVKGRLTINPLAHIDPLGAVMVIFFGFGFAKAVPVNMFNFKPNKRKLYMALTAIAGPVSNLIMAYILLVVYCLLDVTAVISGEFGEYITMFFYYAASVNVSLAVFNLLPIPPLDGSRILNAVLPDKYYYKIMQYERYIIMGVFLLLVFDILDKPIALLSNLFMNLIYILAAYPFTLF